MTDFVSDDIKTELELIDNSISKLIISTEKGKELAQGRFDFLIVAIL